MGSDHSRFAVMIVTNGRPDHVITHTTLRRSGYTGRILLVIDDEDVTGEEYRRRYGEDVIVFDKRAVAQTFDTADSTGDRRSDVFARNASFGLARELGLDYFVQLDDDYSVFSHRWVDAEGSASCSVRSMDEVFEAMLTFLDDSGAATVAFSQGGDHLSGVQRELRQGLLRKAMNSFFCRTDRPMTFLGRLNNDVNSYVVHGGRGALLFTVMGLQLSQKPTQGTAGGMTETYQAAGTYMKSFYTVMMAPSCVQVAPMRSKYVRHHHQVRWDHAVPKILSPKHQKAQQGNSPAPFDGVAAD